MARIRSQDYDVDNRYSQSQINGTPGDDNDSGKKFLRNYTKRDRVAKKNPIAPDNKDENKHNLLCGHRLFQICMPNLTSDFKVEIVE